MVDKRASDGSSRRKRPRGGRSRAAGASTAGENNTERHARELEKEMEDDAEEARIRELVFGRGDANLLSSFGTEIADASSSSTATPTTAAGFTSTLTSTESGESEQQQPLWVEDVTGDNGHGSLGSVVAVGDDVGGVLKEGVGVESVGVKTGPAWIDEDDADLKVDISAKNRLRKLRQHRNEGEMTGADFEQRLRSRFASSNVTADWATSAEHDALGVSKGKKASRKRRDETRMTDSSDDGGDHSGEESDNSDAVDALLRNSSSLKGGKGGVLEPGFLNIVRCKDANQHDPAKAVVRAVNFHPTGQLLLAGGFDKTLRLFQVDGVRNSKIHSIFFEDLPITNALFTTPDQAVITGRRSFFYWYDVPTGKVQKVPRVFSSGRAEKYLETFAASPDGRWLAFVGDGGHVLLLSNKTKQWVAEFKLNSNATAVSFTPDSNYVLASGADADVYKFDVRSRRCVLRFFNEGGTCTTSIAASPSSTHRRIAVGSDSGVVNMYDSDVLESGRGVLRPSPLKAIMSLTTPVTTAKFSPDGQMLAIASNQKRDALKVIHASTCSAFTNWPTERTPVRYPFALDFSPGGGFLAVGNDRGCVLLYRVRHYAQA